MLPKWNGNGKDLYFDEKWNAMKTMFPNVNEHFCPNVADYDFLDEEYLETNSVVIYYRLGCDKCEDHRESSVVIPVFRNHNITIRDLYEECDKHWKDYLCEHMFLRDWDIVSEAQVTPIFKTLEED